METQPTEQQQQRRRLAEALGGEIIPVTIELFEPYVKFAKEYMQFFNVHDDFSIFLMRLIYNELERLHRELTIFVEDDHFSKHFISGEDWYNKNPHIACTATQPTDEDC